MNRQELIEVLQSEARKLVEQDQSKQIEDLKNMINYLQNEVKQLEGVVRKQRLIFSDIENSLKTRPRS